MTDTSPRLLIRVDATRGAGAMGTGHAMRCLTLARAWRARGGRVECVTAAMPEDIAERYAGADVALHRLADGIQPGGEEDGSALADLAARSGAGWVVADGYHLSSAFAAALSACSRLLVITDHGRGGWQHAAAILDQNLGAEERTYAGRPADSRLLLGPRFALVDPAFAAVARRLRDQTPRHVLVVLGGAPPEPLVDSVAEVAQRLRDTGLTVTLVGRRPRHPPIGVEWPATTQRMAELMRTADLAVASAGTTTWELCCAGLPALLLAVAPNQVPVARAAADAGAALTLGWWADGGADRIVSAVLDLAGDAGRRRSLAESGMRLVDGRGSARVVDELWPRLALRTVVADDARLLWEWVNDAEVRRWSFSTGSIPWDEHVTWLSGRLADPACLLLMATDESGRPAGQVRFDRRDGTAEVGVSVAPTVRRVGYGEMLIRSGVAAAFAAWPDLEEIVALIKPGNAASVRAFSAAGFVPDGMTTKSGVQAVRMRQERAGALVRR